MSKKARDKGKRGEREFVEYLRKQGFTAKRTGYYQAHKEGEGQDHGDVSVEEYPNFHWEVKRMERMSIYAVIEQARRDAESLGKHPVIAFKKNRGQWWISLQAEVFFMYLPPLERPAWEFMK